MKRLLTVCGREFVVYIYEYEDDDDGTLYLIYVLCGKQKIFFFGGWNTHDL